MKIKQRNGLWEKEVEFQLKRPPKRIRDTLRPSYPNLSMKREMKTLEQKE